MKAFAKYHPFVLLTYFLSVLLVAMFVQNPMLQLLTLVGGCLFCCMLQGEKEIFTDLRFFVPVFLLVALTNPLFSHKGVTVLFFINNNPITFEAFVYGISLSVTVIGVVLWFKAYSLIMTSDKFIYLFGKLIPKLSLVLSMALRFIPMFRRQLKKVNRAQKAMSMYSSQSGMDKIKSASNVFVALIAWAVENAVETSSSMKARGYGLKGRTNFSVFGFNKNDAFLLVICVFLVGVTFVGAVNGVLSFEYYPSIGEIDFSPFSVSIYVAFAVLSLLPFIIEVKEAIVWKYYVSKI